MAGNRVSNTFSTDGAVGNREDLVNMLYRVSPFDTPFISAVEKGKATATRHDWQTDALGARNTTAKVEGDDIVAAGFDAVTPTVRRQNYCQIQYRDFIISDTQEIVNKAGRDSEIALQSMKRGMELKLDIEAISLNNQAAVLGSSSVAPVLAGVPSWIITNVDKAVGTGSNPTGDGSDARSDGTQRSLAESQLKTVLQSIYTNSGTQPDLLLVNPALRPSISAFAGNANRMIDADEKKLVTTIKVYESDWGTLNVMPCRQARNREVFALSTDYWKICWLQAPKVKDLATTGLATKKVVWAQWTVEASNEAASGIIADVSAS